MSFFKSTPEIPEVHPVLKDLYNRINEMDFHETQGKHGSEETEAVLRATWEDPKFKTLVDLLGKRAVLGGLLGGGTRLDVDSSGFYTIYDGYGDGDPEGIEIEKDIKKISTRYNARTIKQALSDFVRYAL